MAELTARLRTAPILVRLRGRGARAARRRRPGRTAFQVAGIAAVVAAFAGLGALVASPSGASPPQAPPRLVVAERTDLRGTLRDARLTQALGRRRAGHAALAAPARHVRVTALDGRATVRACR